MIKILVTVGPASDSYESLVEFSKKTNLFRLNGSHNTIEWHRQTLKKIRDICPDAFILIDIPGVKPRTSNTDIIEIANNQEVVFGVAQSKDPRLCVGLTKDLPSLPMIGSCFSVNDGQFSFEVVDVGDSFVIGRSESSFKLLPKKGINLPGSVYNEKRQLQIYSEFIEEINGLEVDGLGLSFVQTRDLVSSVRKIAPNMVLVSKIENSEGLRNCNAIIEASDAVMIDRGDLAAEIGVEILYNRVERIAFETKSNGKPLIMATENLESMIGRSAPSKSEVMSISHSASIGADCIMLSEETATAENGVAIVNWLHGFVKKVSTTQHYQHSRTKEVQFPEIWRMIECVEDLPAIVMSKSGHAFFNFLAVRPNQRLTLVTDNIRLQKTCRLMANDVRIIESAVSKNTPIETIWDVLSKNVDVLFKESDRVVCIYVSKYVKSARANCVTIFDRLDF